MKKMVFFLMISIMLLPSNLNASGKVWSEVDENNVAKVHHDSAYFNCCAEVSFRREIEGFKINIYEDDTASTLCYCMCYYNFTHVFLGLEPGTYTCYVWERPGGEDFVLAGVTSFTIKGKYGELSSYSEKTGCLGVKEEHSKENNISLEFTNIIEGKNSGGISFMVSGDENMTLSIYNMAGMEIKRFNLGENESCIKWDLRNRRGVKIGKGIYFVKLQGIEGIVIKPLIVIE